MARCLLIPGMGANARMLAPQIDALPDVRALEWIEPASSREPVTEYAARLAATIDCTLPFLLGGVSFGGLVALEVARHVLPAAVLLIASWRARAVLPLHLQILAHAGPWIPYWSFQAAVRSGLAAHAFGLHTRAQRALFAAMFLDASPTFLHWAARVMASWPGAQTLELPVRQLHGADDHVIPAKRVRADIVVPGAGHLVNLTHPEAVNRFLRREIENWLS